MSFTWHEMFDFAWCGFETGRVPDCPRTMLDAVEQVWRRARAEVTENREKGVLAEVGEIGRVMVARIGDVYGAFVRQSTVGRVRDARVWRLADDEEIRCAWLHASAHCEPAKAELAEAEIRAAEELWRQKMIEGHEKGFAAVNVIWSGGTTVWETAERMWVTTQGGIVAIETPNSPATCWVIRESFEKRLGIRVRENGEIEAAAVVAALRGLGK